MNARTPLVALGPLALPGREPSRSSAILKGSASSSLRWCFLALFLLGGRLDGISYAAQPPQSPAAIPRLDPNAVAIMRQMSDYLGGLKAFTVHCVTSSEVMLTTGQKVQYLSAYDAMLRRPDRYHSRLLGPDEWQFFYDGKTYTAYGVQAKYYASAPVPGGLDRVLDALQERFGTELPALDLLYSKIFEGMMPQVTDALYLGVEQVSGVIAHHLAFRTPEVDWQIWIADGAKPLPYRYLITSKLEPGALQHCAELSNWNTAPKIDDASFVFRPPAGVKKVEFLTLKQPK